MHTARLPCLPLSPNLFHTGVLFTDVSHHCCRFIEDLVRGKQCTPAADSRTTVVVAQTKHKVCSIPASLPIATTMSQHNCCRCLFQCADSDANREQRTGCTAAQHGCMLVGHGPGKASHPRPVHTPAGTCCRTSVSVSGQEIAAKHQWTRSMLTMRGMIQLCRSSCEGCL